ncbi:RNA polymerase, sigma-24 subunit, ECF subfamily, partial [Rhodopirellula maiorica SM1]
MEESTAFLIERHRQNDPAAFEKLVGRYHSLVFGVCMRFMRHRQDAEDMTQETFSRLARYLSRWDSKRPIEPWLVTIAGNRCRTVLSRHRHEVATGVPVEPAADRVQEKIAADSLREEVRLALASQPENHRRAFELFHEQSMNYAEIASQLDCPLGTAKTWVHRARVAIMDQLLQREVVVASKSVVAAEVKR